MKKIYIILAMLTVLGTLSTTAQNKVIRIIQDGNVLQSYPIEEVDSIVIDHVINAPTGLKATIEGAALFLCHGQKLATPLTMYIALLTTTITLL